MDACVHTNKKQKFTAATWNTSLALPVPSGNMVQIYAQSIPEV